MRQRQRDEDLAMVRGEVKGKLAVDVKGTLRLLGPDRKQSVEPDPEPVTRWRSWAGAKAKQAVDVKDGSYALAGPSGSEAVGGAGSSGGDSGGSSGGSGGVAAVNVKGGSYALAGSPGSEAVAAGSGSAAKAKEGSWRPACKTCGKQDAWRRMLEQWDGQDRHFFKNDGLTDTWVRTYLCAPCVATERGLTPEGSLAYILENRPGFQKRMAQNSEYVHALAHHQPGLAKGKLHEMTRAELKVILEPLAVFLVRKERVLGRRNELMKEHAQLAEQLALCHDRRRAEELMAEMERVYDAIDATHTPLAFAERVERAPTTSF